MTTSFKILHACTQSFHLQEIVLPITHIIHAKTYVPGHSLKDCSVISWKQKTERPPNVYQYEEWLSKWWCVNCMKLQMWNTMLISMHWNGLIYKIRRCLKEKRNCRAVFMVFVGTCVCACLYVCVSVHRLFLENKLQNHDFWGRDDWI